MKGISKTEICELIMDMEVESCQIIQPLGTTLDIAHPKSEGREFLYQRSGVVTIRIKGKMTKPDSYDD